MSRFVERSYGGKIFRPSPQVHIEEDASFGVIATSWGNKACATKCIDILKDYVLSARQDMEATSPFQKLTCLSPLANSLRVGVLLANDSIYREENKNEYTSGVELFVFAHQEGELAYAQVGLPHFFVAREGLPWISVGTQIDFAAEMSRQSNLMAPIPQNVIGLHSTTNVNISSFKTHSGDRLIFLSHSLAASAACSLPYENTSLENITQSLAQKNADLPFWVGLLDMEN